MASGVQPQMKNLKQDAQTQVVDIMQALYVCVIYEHYDIVGRFTSILYVSWEGGGFQVSSPPMIPLSSGHATYNTLIRKPFDIFRRLHPVKFFARDAELRITEIWDIQTTR